MLPAELLKMKKILIIFISVGFLLTTRVEAQDLLSTNDLREQIDLSGLEISPDGKRLLVLTSRPNYDANDFITELVMIDVETKEQRVLSKRSDISSATWSPAGDRIAFLGTVDDVSQVFTLSLQGGEAQQITTNKGGILHYSWSPDGKRFAYIAEEDPITKTGPERFNDSFEVGSNDYLTRKASTQNYIGIIETSAENNKRLTSSGTSVATEFYNSSLSWSPDGRLLAATIYPSSRSGDSDLGKIHLLDIDSQKLQPLTSNENKEGPAYFLPDGKRLIFFYPRDGIPANVVEIYSASPGGSASSVTRTLDREILDFAWFSDGRLLLMGYDGLQSAIWAQTDSFKKLNIGEVSEVYELSVSKSGSVAFIGEEKYRPVEVFVLSNIDSEPERITNFNQRTAERKQGKREGITWNSTSGFEADGVITYPPDFDASKKYPLVLHIHGGPTAATTLAFHMTAQLMAAKGWIVLQPNYRGSNHRGNAFQSAIANDAGEGPGADVWSGVEAMKKKPYIDASKVAVSGWSYGGWMTAWMISRYPGEWAAAVAGAAPVDYTDMYSLSDLNRMQRHAITASPYSGDNLKGALEQSPLKNFSKIRTPTLILSKSADSRVSITGSYKLFRALRDNGVKTQFIVYPGPGHVVTDPVRSKDVYDRWLNWLAQYLQPQR
jgi:dipeptidyl aminopeptidase/acylaminoacyl peptidase